MLRAGGRALAAFHVSDAECRPGEARRLAEWWGQAVDAAFQFHAPKAVTGACAAAGLAVGAVLRRAPYPGVELARKPA